VNNVGALEIIWTEGEFMPQELAGIIVDTLAGDNQDDEEIPEWKMLWTCFMMDIYRNSVQVCFHIKCMCTFAVLEY